MRNKKIVKLNKMAREASELLAAMANEKRLMILCHLLDGETSVNELAELVAMNQSALSQQLAKLRALKLVNTRRDAQQVYYRLASVEVERILQTLYGIYCDPQAKTAKIRSL
ncbi:MAG: ArsR family transcriptional regulator [Mesorhizobium sp.]|uniref:ArsR/SmtB family transcription factor n=1 Tax=Mesorhizobium sp. TaxID=1871066 RepID=UPI000FE86F32|nr:metalloregulator ArsR/SmtB family transcription factor [Mesorhizobium sp.]RWH81303.1 MAG: ArsR family transcriptional regulator [Mesorhizobium sp.]RWH85724.1 MAG: ArsR family transcriptional regulator [Mesorhizobium sp.]RWH90981.1 MAG: ArsR family transcriptional regulator [Mesorhizobium sp.]RWH99663.1 MAG: ArsR family transcriptional regulator [Mesorhizobium sp.]RWI04095.1 MAG: ArsR family transcriptional regulator [Mesorhizobium sp.]